jgi:hypothetical protein
VSTPPPPVPGGEARAALIAGVACYTLWGFLPLLFMALARAGSSPWEILAHRTMWSVLWAGLLVILASQGAQLWRVLRQPRTMAPADGLHRPDLVNWAGYVWATTNGATLEAALGYYLNPLLNMAAGACSSASVSGARERSPSRSPPLACCCRRWRWAGRPGSRCSWPSASAPTASSESG